MSSLVPVLLDSISVKGNKARPETQAHPKWELMRVNIMFYMYTCVLILCYCVVLCCVVLLL
jgi:hypothetical protein